MSELDTHVCIGPDAGQLLGFLCSLGLLEAGMRSLPEHSVRLGFAWHAMAFRPVLTVQPQVEPNQLVEKLHGWVTARAASLMLTCLGDDLPCDVGLFEAVARALLASGDMASSTLLAGCGVARSGSERVDDTVFRTMSGAGHQHFLQFARLIAELTTTEQLRAHALQPVDIPRPWAVPALRSR